jgi:hypothetical protein
MSHGRMTWNGMCTTPTDSIILRRTLSNHKTGLLLNFNTIVLKDGIRRCML